MNTRSTLKPWSQGNHISKGKALVLSSCGALCLMAAIALPAHALDATTQITIAADNSRLSITAPLKVDMAVLADGTFVAPSASECQIINKSIFGVHVSGLTITPAQDYTIKTQDAFSEASEPDALWMGIQPNGKTTIQAGSHLSSEPLENGSEWNMTSVNGESATIDLGFSGAIKNVRALSDAPTKVYDITWTFAAGEQN